MPITFTTDELDALLAELDQKDESYTIDSGTALGRAHLKLKRSRWGAPATLADSLHDRRYASFKRPGDERTPFKKPPMVDPYEEAVVPGSRGLPAKGRNVSSR